MARYKDGEGKSSGISIEEKIAKSKKEPTGAVDIVSLLMEVNHYSCATLAGRIGTKNTYIWDRLYNSSKQGTDGKEGTKDLKVSIMSQMLAGMDYKLVAVPRDKPLREGEYQLK